MMTIETFNKIVPGDVFASGIMPNSPEGLYMTNSGGELRWIAKKGYGDDWAIYCHWSYNDEEWIKEHGDKVTSETHIKRCVPCDTEVFKKYRY
ncbi:MAG: hypothetical protein PHF86_01365 [Candidatus Nanoarchaeia archaeon]|nr:hypothetical protein [Candidatus Nanoarchaeia archaeon]